MTLNNGAGSPRVLIVEDNPANAMLARAVLKRAGYQVDEARSADEARRQIQAALPDLILMDIQLPGQDGLTFTRQLKADPATAGILIVALTAHAMKEDRERAAAAGCDGYIAKPFETRALAGQVAEVLNARRGGLQSGG